MPVKDSSWQQLLSMLENAPSSSDAAGAALLQRGQCVAKPWSHTWAQEGALGWSCCSSKRSSQSMTFVQCRRMGQSPSQT